MERTRSRRTFTGAERELFDLPAESVEVEDLWFEIAIDQDWRAAFRMVPYGTGRAIAEVRVFPRDDWPDRHAGEWRAQALGEAARTFDGKESIARSSKRRRPSGEAVPPSPARFPAIGRGLSAAMLRKVRFDVLLRFEHDLAASAPQPERKERRGPGAWLDSRYAKIAAYYAERCADRSRSPNRDVAARFRSLSPEQVRDAIHTARQRGILSPTPARGVPGGKLTDYGKSLLKKGS